MKKRSFLRVFIPSVLCCILLALAALLTLNALNRHRMLKAVRLENAAGLRQIDYTNWSDPLRYKDGYEIMAFSVDEQSWKMPEEWTREADTTDLSDLEESLHISLDYQGIWGLSLGGVDCSAWYFTDGRNTEKPFDQRDFYLGYLNNNIGKKLIFIYHGHHLHGIE